MAGTTNVDLSEAEYVDLGAAPVSVQALGGNMRIAVADTQPADDFVGTFLPTSWIAKIDQADASSHVWAQALGSSVHANVTPILASGGGGGGGDVNIAEVGGNAVSSTVPVNTPVSKIVTQAPTVTAAAYTSGNCIGGLLTFAGVVRAAGISGLLQMAGVFSKSAQSGAVDLVLFSANPTASTFTDKAALAVAVADFDKVMGVVHITDWTPLGTPSFAQGLGLAMPFVPAAGTTIYGVLVARSTPTFASTSDIEVYVKALDD